MTGPDRLALVLSVAEQYTTYPRPVTFTIEGLVYHRWSKVNAGEDENPLTADEKELADQLDTHRDALTPTQTIGAYIIGVRGVRGEPEVWEIEGTVHDTTIDLFGRKRRPDLDFRARFSTKNRKGTFEFIYPDLDPMKGCVS